MRARPIALLAFVATPPALAAQSAPMPTPRLAVSLFLGAPSGGPGADVENALAGQGYTESFGGCSMFGCFPEQPSPSLNAEGQALGMTIRYRHRRYLGAELVVGQAAKGSVKGRGNGESLTVDYGGTVIAPMLWVGGTGPRLAAGPALLRGRWDFHDSQAPQGRGGTHRTTTVGWMASGTIRLPMGRVMAMELTGHYRAFGRATVRPPGEVSVFRAEQVRQSHLWLAVGPSFSLRL